MKEVVVIVAGGSGKRMKSELPKQFIELLGRPILMHTLEQFYKYSPEIDIRLVLPKKEIDTWKNLVEEHNFSISHEICPGGASRFHSVQNGLDGLDTETLIAIHDGVRPLVSKETITKGFQTAHEKGTAIPVIDVHETIREINGNESKTVNRDKYKLVQTPQVFRAEVLLLAYTQSFREEFTDDASVVESMGKKIHLFEGNRENIKITAPNDLKIAEAYLR
jgi:2-C-methyl-D-erythritol 4-phosphate cytidylyltransferase